MCRKDLFRNIYEWYVCLAMLHSVAQNIGSIELDNETFEKHYLYTHYLRGVAVLDSPQ